MCLRPSDMIYDCLRLNLQFNSTKKSISLQVEFEHCIVIGAGNVLITLFSVLYNFRMYCKANSTEVNHKVSRFLGRRLTY